ncbi:hypothetical protein HDV00_010057 [Rhizophlyctis rosea]|nr:hypothetical protein HDV00_010057 [Rhizophlyctis rosea]
MLCSHCTSTFKYSAWYRSSRILTSKSRPRNVLTYHPRPLTFPDLAYVEPPATWEDDVPHALIKTFWDESLNLKTEAQIFNEWRAKFGHPLNVDMRFFRSVKSTRWRSVVLGDGSVLLLKSYAPYPSEEKWVEKMKAYFKSVLPLSKKFRFGDIFYASAAAERFVSFVVALPASIVGPSPGQPTSERPSGGGTSEATLASSDISGDIYAPHGPKTIIAVVSGPFDHGETCIPSWFLPPVLPLSYFQTLDNASIHLEIPEDVKEERRKERGDDMGNGGKDEVYIQLGDRPIAYGEAEIWGVEGLDLELWRRVGVGRGV